MNPISLFCRRFSFAFSLRAIFLLLTLLGIFLGWLIWQRQVVLDRLAMRVQLESQRAWFVPDSFWAQLTINRAPWRHGKDQASFRQKLAMIEKSHPQHGSVSLVRQWFGDEYIDGICISDGLENDRHGIESLFPEATIVADSAVEIEMNDKILAILSRATRFELDNVPLRDALDYLKDLHGLEIQIEEGPLWQSDQIDDSVPVAYKAEDIPLNEALRKLLAPAGLTFVMRHHVVTITRESQSQDCQERPPGVWVR